ncbi:hypothetical protein [Pengzhenrongella frigida]|uniref:Uncharacterized protein n=1 Tax=Pengzhenrongella frigida TaxID=1259133 RepID=A0A4Q5N0G4_9MICO|nr:hypothetical protein [Cellulomonas sp. HLT2-17]RYV51506.1 hypothetical protein EUA98_07935 [Cellulomonas sp. HLT2-17]
MSPRRRARALLVAGSVLFLLSVAAFVLVPSSVALGWFAYAPLTETAFTPGFGLDSTHRWAVAVGVASLVAASWAAGYLAGRRAE